MFESPAHHYCRDIVKVLEISKQRVYNNNNNNNNNSNNNNNNTIIIIKMKK